MRQSYSLDTGAGIVRKCRAQKLIQRLVDVFKARIIERKFADHGHSLVVVFDISPNRRLVDVTYVLSDAQFFAAAHDERSVFDIGVGVFETALRIFAEREEKVAVFRAQTGQIAQTPQSGVRTAKDMFVFRERAEQCAEMRKVFGSRYEYLFCREGVDKVCKTRQREDALERSLGERGVVEIDLSHHAAQPHAVDGDGDEEKGRILGCLFLVELQFLFDGFALCGIGAEIEYHAGAVRIGKFSRDFLIPIVSRFELFVVPKIQIFVIETGEVGIHRVAVGMRVADEHIIVRIAESLAIVVTIRLSCRR